MTFFIVITTFVAIESHNYLRMIARFLLASSDMGWKMSKNIKISDIDNAKLLNGEMNKSGIKLCNEFASFVLDNNENYDRVIGILEVDDENKAVLDDNNKPNFI